MSFELRHLRALVAVSEELNVSRAARRLQVAPQTLTRQVRQLEEQLGIPLVERSSPGRGLTLAGQAYVERAREVLAAVDSAGDFARRAALDTPALRVGFAGTVGGHLAPTIDEYRERRPDVDVQLSFGDLLDPSGGLREGAVDVASVGGRFDPSGLHLAAVGSSRMGVAMSAGHPLAGKERLTIQEYLREPTFWFPSPDPAFRDFWMGVEYRGGRPPWIVAEFRSIDGLVDALHSARGVQLATDLLVDGASAGLVWRPVEGISEVELFLAWCAGDAREHVLAFVDLARNGT